MLSSVRRAVSARDAASRRACASRASQARRATYWFAVSAATTTRASCHDGPGALQTRLGGRRAPRGCRRTRRAPSSPAGRRLRWCRSAGSGPGGRGWTSAVASSAGTERGAGGNARRACASAMRAPALATVGLAVSAASIRRASSGSSNCVHQRRSSAVVPPCGSGACHAGRDRIGRRRRRFGRRTAGEKERENVVVRRRCAWPRKSTACPRAPSVRGAWRRCAPPARSAAPRGCSRKKRSISRDASGPAGSVYEPAAAPPDHAWPAPCTTQCSARLGAVRRRRGRATRCDGTREHRAPAVPGRRRGLRTRPSTEPTTASPFAGTTVGRRRRGRRSPALPRTGAERAPRRGGRSS